MKHNHQVSKKQPLLNQLGQMSEPGYAFKSIFEYDRKQVKASIWRIKEWYYYDCINDDFAFAFTVADLGYLGMLTATYLNFKTEQETKKTFMIPFPFGKLKLPNDIESGNVLITRKNYSFNFEKHDDSRVLEVTIKDFLPGKDFSANLVLADKHDERMVIATPWKENKHAFYYNQKINCMPTSGEVTIGEEKFLYQANKHFSVLDWGRGVWTYKNTWYWGSLSGLVNGKRFGFNIGYGFGDTSAASENMLFYDGKAHKLNDIKFELDDLDVLKPWRFSASDDRLNLVMTPVLDRVDHTNLVIIKNFGHQVYGKFNGYVILDDGTKLEIKDLIGFAEKITNHY